MTRITLGADPEFAITSTVGGSTLMAACDILGGTKEAPTTLEGGYGVGLHADGVAGEITVYPTENPDSFADCMATAWRTVQDELGIRYNARIASRYISGVRFPENLLTNPESRRSGCLPDNDAWEGGGYSKKVADYSRTPWRGLGGHIHVGGDFNCPSFVTALFLSATAGMLARRAEVHMMLLRPANERAQIAEGIDFRTNSVIGSAAFREKPYGIEWRTPSNAWLMSIGDYGYAVGASVYQVARYLATTSASVIRRVLEEELPWADIRELLERPVSPLLSDSENVQEYMYALQTMERDNMRALR